MYRSPTIHPERHVSTQLLGEKTYSLPHNKAKPTLLTPDGGPWKVQVKKIDKERHDRTIGAIVCIAAAIFFFLLAASGVGVASSGIALGWHGLMIGFGASAVLFGTLFGVILGAASIGTLRDRPSRPVYGFNNDHDKKEGFYLLREGSVAQVHDLLYTSPQRLLQPHEFPAEQLVLKGLLPKEKLEEFKAIMADFSKVKLAMLKHRRKLTQLGHNPNDFLTSFKKSYPMEAEFYTKVLERWTKLQNSLNNTISETSTDEESD